MKVVKIISHPSYNNPRLSNDIALLQLEKQAILNNRVGVVCLPKQDFEVPLESNCYITGETTDQTFMGLWGGGNGEGGEIEGGISPTLLCSD